MEVSSIEARPTAAPVEAIDRTPERLVRNIGFMTISQGLTWSAALVWALIVPRILGPRGIGLIVMSTALTGLLFAIFGFGGGALVVKEVSTNFARGSRVLSAALSTRVLMLPLCLGASLVYAVVNRFDADQVVVVLLAGGMAACSLVGDPFRAVLQASEQMKYMAYADVLNKAAVNIFGIAAVLTGHGATTVVIITAIVAILITVLHWIYARRYVRASFFPSPLKDVGNFFVTSVAFWSVALVFTFYAWVDSTILSLLAPTAVVGWYGTATKLSQTLMFLPTILMTAWIPRIAAVTPHGPDAVARWARLPMELLLIVSLPIGVGATMLGGPVFTALYGPAFAPAVLVLQILCITLIPAYVNTAACQVLLMANRQWFWTKLMIATSIANVVMNVLLIPFFQRMGNGAIGAAISLLLTELLISGLAWGMTRSEFHLELSRGRIGKAIVATAIMAASVLAVWQLNFFVRVFVGMAVFVIVSRLLRLWSDQEIAEARRIARKVIPRQLIPGWS